MKSPQSKPQIDPSILKKKKGLIIVNTGDGKGKTTAALGVAVRALGAGMKVCMVQFIKGNWTSGEHKIAEKLGPDFEIHRKGEGFTWDTKNRARDQKLVREAWQLCQDKLASGKYQLLIFDEINYVIDYDYLSAQEVLEVLHKKSPDIHVILTGRNAKPELIEAADLVTEMREVKHPFKDQNLPAQIGIDF